MKIFNKRILPLLKKSDIDFLISAGNAVKDGAEDKYRILNRSFKKMDIPYILAVGSNEVEDLGMNRFYRHFGPLLFSFNVGEAYFVFLDSTGETSWEWQKPWLEKELASAQNFKYRFVIIKWYSWRPWREAAL
ncbi:MAG: metallophosphoesterase family protein [bacterium]